MRGLAKHLRRLGHRCPVFVGNSAAGGANGPRLAGLEDVHARHRDITIVELNGGIGYEGGTAAATDVLRSRATAVMSRLLAGRPTGGSIDFTPGIEARGSSGPAPVVRPSR